MANFKDLKAKYMQDPEFRKEYESLQPEMDVIRAIIDARTKQNLTQAQLAERTGIRQSNISRIENGNCSPTVETLQQLAKGMEKTSYRIHLIGHSF